MELVFTPFNQDWNQGSPPNPDTVWTSDSDDDETEQYDNALVIQFGGGYGMFNDDYKHAPHYGAKVIICHDCAHDLCNKIPWLGELLDPYSSHAHITEYQEDHPEHIGWDYHTTEERNEYR